MGPDDLAERHLINGRVLTPPLLVKQDVAAYAGNCNKPRHHCWPTP